MTTSQKIIRSKVGLLELGKQLGNVSQACKIMATAGTALTARRNRWTTSVGISRGDAWRCRRCLPESLEPPVLEHLIPSLRNEGGLSYRHSGAQAMLKTITQQTRVFLDSGARGLRAPAATQRRGS
jgi:hypothetical protein